MKSSSFCLQVGFIFFVMAFAVSQSQASLQSSMRRPTIVTHQNFFGESEELSGSRMWRSPKYLSQRGVMGWEKNLFSTPAEMKPRVQFWKDIYTKYSTKQGVIHDSENIDLVYSEVDFSDIEANRNLSGIEKEKMKKKRIDDGKAEALSRLKRVAKFSHEAEIKNKEDRRVWRYFFENNDLKGITKAANIDRIRFQLGLSDRMRKAIFVSGRYLEEMEEIFREEGLPIELTRLVFVESSFNVMARSKVGASGLWQIMPGTAKPYGYLREGVDKRNHPMYATRLAAKILKGAYGLLQSWPLAITAYNHGPSGMKRLSQRYKTDDIAELIEKVNHHETFGFASKNFYASFLAALEVEQNSPLHFKNIVWSKPFDAKPILLSSSLEFSRLLNWFGGDEYKLQVFNPHISKSLMSLNKHIPHNTEIYVPAERFTAAIVDLAFKPNRKVASESKREN